MYRAALSVAIAVLLVMVVRGAAQTATTTTAPPPASNATLEARVTRLEERLSFGLAAVQERIQAVNDRSETSTRMLYICSLFAGFLIIWFTVRDWFTRSTETRQQGEGLKKVNEVIEVVNRTLAFRLQQEEKFVRTVEEIERMKAGQEEKKRQKLAHALGINEHFKGMSRMDYASLTDEQYRRGLRLQTLVNELEDALAEEGNIYEAGSLFYDCGVIAYYDNDVIEAKDYLDRAVACRVPDHDGKIKADEKYRRRFSFIHYFRALIQKNWGDLKEARREIEASMSYEERVGEFLTPVTRAEIRSYFPGDEKICLDELTALIERIRAMEADLKKQGKDLDGNQIRLRNRMLVLSGNVHYIKGDFDQALARYLEAIALQPGDYYAHVSAGQCRQKLGDAAAAKAHFEACLDAIERTGDFRRKRERLTRAVIAATAVTAAKGSGNDKVHEQWMREARDLLSGKLEVDDMEPKFFSPAMKRPVLARELLRELGA